MARWIRDGYNRVGYIKAVDGLYDELRFTYRPVPPDVGSDFLEEIAPLKAGEQDRRTAKLIAEKVVKWSGEDVREPNHPDEAVSVKLALQLNRRQLHRLGGIILGTEPSDPDPLNPSLSAPVDAPADAKN